MALVEPTESALASMSVGDAVARHAFRTIAGGNGSRRTADRGAVDDALAATELRALRERELSTLSAGERQRVWIALALAQRARVIALDEPTTHLDLRFAIETLTLLRRLADEGAIVIAVLHMLEEAASFADRVVLVGEERVLADGPPAAAFTTPNLQAAYGITLEVEHIGGG